MFDVNYILMYRTMKKSKNLTVNGTKVLIYSDKNSEYISLTDIARYKDSYRSDYILQNWMRNRSTIEFVGLWQLFNNPVF